MPFAALFAPDPELMLRKVRPVAPIVVVETLSAVPAVVERVLTTVVLFCVALTVPPAVAVNESFAPVLRLMPPVKLIVAPVLEFRMTPVPKPLFEVTAPVRLIVPPVLFWISTTRCPETACVMVPA